MPAQKNSRLLAGNWTPGKVTLLNALGLSAWKVQYPKLRPNLATSLIAQGGGSNVQTQAQLLANRQPGTGPVSPPSPPGPVGAPGKGGAFTKAQLSQLWINAGGPSSVANIAGAIALAESTGFPNNNNYHDSNGRGGSQTSWGLWQISDGTHGMPVPNIDDPQVNARQAVIKYRGAHNTFQPWGTYTSGAYRQFL